VDYKSKEKLIILAIIFFIAIFSEIFSFADNLKAATIDAASCSQADVRTAINSAAAGDTVLVPAGECAWPSSIAVGKPLSVIGAGSGAGGTKLIAGGSMPEGFFYIHGFNSSSITRITGFYFEMINWTPNYAVIVLNASLDNLRIDYNVFNHGGIAQVWVTGSKGVINNNYFYNGNKAISYSAGSREQADASWNSMAAGTADALFIEDNYFIDDANYSATYTNEKIGTYNGGKLVIRYNHFDGTDISFGDARTISPIMTHGSAAAGCANGYWQQGNGCRRGQSVVEIYNNIIEGKRIDFLATVRGSANLIYNNQIIGKVKYSPRFYLREEEYDGGQWNPARTLWPAEDQVHNTFIWNNTYDGAAMNSESSMAIAPRNSECTAIGSPYSCCTGSKIGTCNEIIVKDRDYFLHAPCGASDATDAYGNICTHGKEIFTGANGASGSYPTDGSIYPTLGTMIFNPAGDNAYYGYTPYTYPHPLRASADAIPPAPPSGLIVN
jgi:hypothetical protein